MATDKILEIVITARDEATKKLEGLSSALKKNEASFKTMANVGTVAFASITTVIGLSVKAYGESERSQRQLEHAILDISKGTKEQVKQVNDLTLALQKKAGIDGDALTAGVAQLSTFGLQSKSVVDLTKSLADLTVNQNGVTATSDDYISSANIMAKALRGEFGILSKMGIRFTEAQQKTILFGTESQKVATIQEGLAQNLRETTDTVTGYDSAMGKVKQQLGEATESIGKSLQPVLIELMTSFAGIATKVAEWITLHPELTKNIIIATAIISGLLMVVGALGLALPPLIAGFGLLFTPVTLIVLAIGALIAIGVALVTHWDYVKQQAGFLWEGIKIYFMEGVNYISTQVIEPIKNMFVEMWTFTKDEFKKSIDGIIKFFEPLTVAVEKVAKKIENAWQKAKDIFSFGDKKGKATGGGVQVGQSYVVGEKGPEMFTPASNGSITPNYALAGAGGGMNLTINMNGGTYLDNNVAEQIGDRIVQNFKRIARF